MVLIDMLKKVFQYSFPAMFILGYLYYLLANHSKKFFVFKRKKKIIKLLFSSNVENSEPDCTKRIIDLLESFEPLYYMDGEINYNEMLNDLTKLRAIEIQKEQRKNILFKIDILIDAIKRKNTYIKVSNLSAEIFKRISESLKVNNITRAQEDLELLYQRCGEVERHIRNNKRKEFWTGLYISIIGAMVSVIITLIKQ